MKLTLTGIRDQMLIDVDLAVQETTNRSALPFAWLRNTRRAASFLNVVRFAVIRMLGVIGLILIAGHSFAQTPSSNGSPSALKKLTLTELMDLDVTSVAKKPEPYREAAAAIQIITGDDIRRSGASSIPEALRLADNLIVAQKTSHSWAISARGFNTDSANKLLVLMDGRSVYTPLYSGVFWDQQNYLLEDLDRIEVVSGPGGTLWGANAVNGIINVIRKSAKDTQGFFVEVGGGMELQDFVGVRYGGKLGPNVAFRVYGKFFDRGNQVFPNGTAASDSWRMGQGGFRIDAKRSSRTALTLQGEVYNGDENLAPGGNSRFSGGNILGRWSHTFADSSNVSLQFYYDRTHLNLPAPGNAFARAGTLIDNLDTYDLDFQHRFRLGERNQLVWGLGYRFTHDVVENAPALAFLPATLNHHQFNGFAQDELMLTNSLSLIVGTKVEHISYTGLEFEPSARLAWRPTGRQIIWAAISRAIRAPSRVDRDIRLPTPAIAPIVKNILIGGANFKSETVIAYELGYRAQLGSKVSVSVSTFYNVYDNVRSTSVSPPPALFGFPLFYENNLEGQTHGIELSVNYQALKWWRLHGGYDFLKEDIHVKAGRTDFNNAINETADPEHQFSIRSSMDLPKEIELDAGLRWVDSFRFNNNRAPATVPSYFELDARLGWHLRRDLEFSIVGQNLLHDHHLEYVISGANPREEIVRSVYGKVTWRF
jgi:iron complex outermembrane receptor protein